jgi:hypothetical protein
LDKLKKDYARMFGERLAQARWPAFQ